MAIPPILTDPLNQELPPPVVDPNNPAAGGRGLMGTPAMLQSLLSLLFGGGNNSYVNRRDITSPEGRAAWDRDNEEGDPSWWSQYGFTRSKPYDDAAEYAKLTGRGGGAPPANNGGSGFPMLQQLMGGGITGALAGPRPAAVKQPFIPPDPQGMLPANTFLQKRHGLFGAAPGSVGGGGGGFAPESAAPTGGGLLSALTSLGRR